MPVDSPPRHRRSIQAYAAVLPDLSSRALERLSGAKILLAGCGGLGGHVLDQALRAGIGVIRAVDGDTFEPSNLNRQLLCTPDRLGLFKAAVARQYAAHLNPEVRVEAVPQRATPGDWADLLHGLDAAVDALDNAADRLALAAAAKAAGIPLIHGAVSGFYGQAALVPPGSDLMERLYPPQRREDEAADRRQGTAGPAPALIGAVQSAELIKLLLGAPGLLHDRLFVCDLAAPYCHVIDMSPGTVSK